MLRTATSTPPSLSEFQKTYKGACNVVDALRFRNFHNLSSDGAVGAIRLLRTMRKLWTIQSEGSILVSFGKKMRIPSQSMLALVQMLYCDTGDGEYAPIDLVIGWMNAVKDGILQPDKSSSNVGVLEALPTTIHTFSHLMDPSLETARLNERRGLLVILQKDGRIDSKRALTSADFDLIEFVGSRDSDPKSNGWVWRPINPLEVKPERFVVPEPDAFDEYALFYERNLTMKPYEALHGRLEERFRNPNAMSKDGMRKDVARKSELVGTHKSRSDALKGLVRSRRALTGEKLQKIMDANDILEPHHRERELRMLIPTLPAHDAGESPALTTAVFIDELLRNPPRRKTPRTYAEFLGISSKSSAVTRFKLPSRAVRLDRTLTERLRVACAHPDPEEQIKALRKIPGSMPPGDHGASTGLTLGTFIDETITGIRRDGYSRMWGKKP